MVVTGFIERIAEGREFNDSRAIIASPVNTAIIKLRVSSAMKGTPGRYVYIEHVIGGISTEVLDASKTAGELQVYLVKQPGDGYGEYVEVTNSDGGLMDEVDVLYDPLNTESITLVDGARLSEELRKRVSPDAVRSNVDP